MSEETTDDAVEFAHQLFDAAREGNTEFVLTAIDQGVPIDLSDAKGNTLLMLAAYHSHGELVAGLVERGADVNRLNDRGQSPLAGAVFKRADDVIRVLLAHGADPGAGSPTARATARMFGIDLIEHVGESARAEEDDKGGEAN
ncbi:ankyrin repeat domain-containing protein [Leucobacter denitrificans]|uniref:Ankyrin repeat domain-containing protein n=1 Tax=Leucobacter denitrificans TaxID=683042 RepID=A0A7G9S597_9MICO|nr:ankyrin repeat domain-containing protein [Leucobacter denitrificans]QNN63022.1 ankyrin repeat domain-containing protein [Leucobacter denitrificans]